MKNISIKKTMGIFLIIAVAVICVLNSHGLFKCMDSKYIKDIISSYGAIGPLIYIIMFSLVPLTLFPDSILAVAGGMAFGLFWGSVYTIIGAAIGGSISFYISRIFGRNIVEKLVRGKGKWFDEGVEKKGFIVILTLRLIPLVPFDIISYGAGLSKIKYWDFLLGTLIGIIPGVLIFSNLGDKTLNVKSPEFVKAVGLLIFLFICSYFLKRKISFEKVQSDAK
ncbi:MAG: TVP38/TMEM64 family protein [Solirubrobacterales bacterium]